MLSQEQAMLLRMTSPYVSFIFRGVLLILLAGGPVLADVLQLTPAAVQQVAQRWGAAGVQRLRDWQAMADSLVHAAEAEQIETVNRWLDGLPYISDQEHWHQEDYWATPLEFVGSNGGDCEDFAIAKYFTLRALGVPADKLRITYVEAVDLHQAHMILAYYPQPGQEPLILDSLVKRILPASQRPDLVPVYSFNVEGLWLARLQGRGERIGQGAEVRQWRDVMQRLQSQQVLPMR